MNLILIPDELHKELRLLAVQRDMTLKALAEQLLWIILERLEPGIIDASQSPRQYTGRLSKGITPSDKLHKELRLLAVRKDMTLQALTALLLQMSLELVNASSTQR